MFCHFLETSQVLWWSQWKVPLYTHVEKHTAITLSTRWSTREISQRTLVHFYAKTWSCVHVGCGECEQLCTFILFFFLFLIPGSVKVSSTVLILSTRFGSVFFNVFIQKLRCLSLLTWHVYLPTDRKCRTVTDLTVCEMRSHHFIVCSLSPKE